MGLCKVKWINASKGFKTAVIAFEASGEYQLFVLLLSLLLIRASLKIAVNVDFLGSLYSFNLRNYVILHSYPP